MSNKITIFNAKDFFNKTPISPYGDKTFVFETHDISTNIEMYNVMVSYPILNIPLYHLDKPIRTYRRKANLKDYHHHCLTYFILDIDKVKDPTSLRHILNYFRDYKCIIGESTSFNGINNFNLKGILFTDCIDFNDAKLALSVIQHELKDYCTVDESVVRKVSLNAPIGKNKVFINNENGKLYKFSKQEAQEHIRDITSQSSDAIHIPIEELKDIEVENIEKLCLKVFQTMGFEATKNNPNGSISFKHPEEKKTLGGYYWYSSSPYVMHHRNTTKTINIYDSVRKLPQAKELLKKSINYDSEFLRFNVDTHVITVDEKYLKVNQEIDDSVNDFLNRDNGIFFIRSPMGTGKSTLINHIIEECDEFDMKVLIITNRISVANDFGRKYGLKIYNQDKYNVGDSLICQYDSLWKYDIKKFDVIIMDEFISLMMHVRSNLNNSSVNIAKFFASFKKKIVIADAFLTGYENFLLDKNDNVHMVDNVYRDPTILYNYSDFNYFVNSLVYHAEKHKITVSGTSLSFIHSLEALLKKRGMKVVTLTAETPESTKKLIYELFDKDEHDKWDIIIFSPSLTVGVSNLNEVPYHFHYDSSMSTDVVSSIQMIKRTRKSKEIHMFIRDRINYLKTSYDSIRDEYMVNLGKNIEQNYLFDVDDYGNPRLSEIGKKAIKIDTFKNILEFNHKESMLWLMKYHFLNTPRVIDNVFRGNILHRYKTQLKNDKEGILKSNIEQFLDLNEIEKTDILLDKDANSILRLLAEIDSELLEDAPSYIKSRILEICMKDKGFIDKCKYFKVAFNYTKKIWDESDVKNLVSKSVIRNKNDDLHFYNILLKHGQKEIFDEYLPRTINEDKSLKYILDKCGYKITKRNAPGVVGHRGYVVDPYVKDLYGWIN